MVQMEKTIREAMDRLQLSQEEFSALTDDEVAELLGLYDDTVAGIWWDFFDFQSNDNAFTVKLQKNYIKQINGRLDRFESRFSSALEKSIAKAAAFGASEATKDVESIGGKAKLTKSAHRQNVGEFAASVFANAKEYVTAQRNRMGQQLRAHLKAYSADVYRRSNYENISKPEAARRIGVSSKPKLKFIDNAGRNWDCKKYFNMLVRTFISDARRESYVNTLVVEGHDLVMVSAHGATDRCHSWEMKTISLSGATQGYTTYSQMMASGDIFHPNCRHFLLLVSDNGA